MIRKIVFWTHLVVGIVTGAVTFILCATGAILAFEKQTTDWAERDSRALPPSAGASWLSPDALLASATNVESGDTASMEWFADPKMPVRIRHKNQTFLLLNGYTGEVLGHGATSLRRFFKWNTDLHVSLLAGRTGSWIIATTNLCFIFLMLCGFYLWWPRQWRWKALRSSIAFQFRLKGRARDWNWHNAFGFWFLLPLLFIAASGTVLSYGSVNQWWRIFASAHLLAAAPNPPPAAPVSALKTSPDWNDLLRTVQQRYPAWRSIQFDQLALLTRHSPVALNVYLGQFGERFKTFTVTVDPETNTILKTTGWAEVDAGNRARAIARAGHTGEILGFWSQVLALAACLAGIGLVYTGFALSWRRFSGGKVPLPSPPA